jgi:3-deoxy-manno-octulosonate cytidylyltransferase (CMP-KDO synthetase)
MIEHVYRRAAAAPSVEAVVVATDDERIVRAVEAFGGIAKLTDSSHRSGSDRLAEVAAELECALVVNVQGDEPLIDPQMIEEAIAPFRDEPELQIGTLCRRIRDPREYVDPNVVKVVVGPDGYALYFSRSPIPFVREGRRADPTASGWRPEGDVPAYKHVGLYVYRRKFLLAFARLAPTRLERAEALEQLRALEHGIRLKTVETTRDSIGVDTPEDLERVRHLVAATSCP